MSTLGVCTGACCSVFPLNAGGAPLRSARDWFQERADDDGDWSFIGNMIYPLTLDEAKAHWVAANHQPAPTWFDERHELYGCRHWDSRSRRCTVYEQRPQMCSTYPYSAACEYCGYKHPDLYREPDPPEEPAEVREAMTEAVPAEP